MSCLHANPHSQHTFLRYYRQSMSGEEAYPWRHPQKAFHVARILSLIFPPQHRKERSICAFSSKWIQNYSTQLSTSLTVTYACVQTITIVLILKVCKLQLVKTATVLE